MPRPLEPAAALSISFAAVIAAGTGALRLPQAAEGPPLPLVDALFLSTSAVCVTGLSPVDVSARLSPAGQAALVLLVQLGGLGLMTFGAWISLLLGRRIALRDRLAVEASLADSPRARARRLVRYVLWFTLAAEGIVALLLFPAFLRDHPPGRAAWLAVFHAVSSFCNAGFALFPDNLARYAADPWVSLVICGSIVAGGLGFLVSLELRDHLRRRGPARARRPYSLHARVVLATTAALLAAGTLVFLACEHGNLLAGRPWGERLLAALFLSVTPRTAGFNTVDYGQATTATLLFTLFLMFVGASPGSTGGGVKTTTLALWLAFVRGRWRGASGTALFRRTVPDEVVERAFLVTLLAATVVGAGTLGLALAEHGGPFRGGQPQLLELLFEATSAFGTVGLSTGITPSLSAASKLVLSALMFVGRVGPLTLVLALAARQPERFRHAEEAVMVG